MTYGLTDDELGGFRSWRGCVGQIFTMKQLSVYVGFMELEMAYGMIKRKAL